MADEIPTGDEPIEEEPDAEALAAELDLGIDLSPEEQAEAEAMVARLKEQFGVEEPATDEPEADEDEVEEEEPEEVPTPAAPAPATAAAPPSSRGVVVIDGREVPVEEAVAVLLERDRKAAEKPPEPPKIPEWIDQDDPAQMAMWNELQSVKASQAQIAGNQAQIAQQNAVARATADAEAGISTFRTLHPELSEDDLTKLRLHAVSLDIIDGLAKNRSGPDAILKALDIAYWDHPEFRARAVAKPTPAEAKKKETAERKGKLNALGGSSGSAPRRESQPDLSTDQTAKAAAAAWLKEQNIL